MGLQLKKMMSHGGLSAFVLLVYLFLYMPIAVLVIFSFNNASFPAPWNGFTTRWYYELFMSPLIWQAFYNSLIVSCTATCLSLLMSLCLIYYDTVGGKLRNALLLFYGNIVIPEIVLAVGLLSFLSFCAIPFGLITLIVAHTVLGLGFAIPIVYTRYDALDQRIVEASLDLGATTTQTFFKVMLPFLQPALIAAGMLVFILSFNDFVLSFFCAGSEAQTLSLYIYSMIRSGVSPVVNALSTVMLLLSSLLVMGFGLLNIKTKLLSL